MTERDKLIERMRYDARAELLIGQIPPIKEGLLGSQAIAKYLRAPYLFYELKLFELLHPGLRVLELGAGTGMHTRALTQTGADVVATDISSYSLALLRERFSNSEGNIETAVADMEQLPFEANSFDMVACAGSLSYGEPKLVDSEIRRVLRPGGALVCVDSLNHNPIYRLNRWIHYLRGNRSRSTLIRMPDLNRIKAISDSFTHVDVNYFGALSFIMPLVSGILGENSAQLFSDRFDQWVCVKRSAFKFVIVARDIA
jgi:ubiquinone/menaquinone biosynthesis C-methylase UbiE